MSKANHASVTRVMIQLHYCHIPNCTFKREKRSRNTLLLNAVAENLIVYNMVLAMEHIESRTMQKKGSRYK